MDDERIITGQITITKYLDENTEGGVGIEAEYSEGLPLIEAMGLLTHTTLCVREHYFPDEAET